jgi:uncharacterized damage-inducible protein DinB
MMKLDQYFEHWQPVRADLLVTVDKFSDEELSYVPFPDSRPVGEIIRHIANAEDGWFRYVIKRELSDWPSEFMLAVYPTIAATKTVLDEVHRRTQRYLSGWDVADLDQPVESPWGQTFKLGWIIWHVLEHEIHHRGELSFILGLLGREGLEV